MQTVNNEESFEALPRHRTEPSIYETLHRQTKNHNESISHHHNWFIKNQPYYPQPYNNPPFAPSQQQSAFNPYGQPNMYGHYDYGAHHNFGGSSSKTNFGGSSSQPNVGSSSSQPNVRGSSSLVRKFSLDDEDFTNVYSLRCSESFREEQSPVEEVEEIQVPEETALCKSWVRTSEDSVKGNMRKERGFWIDILNGVYGNAIQTYTSGASDSDYLQRALTDYQADDPYNSQKNQEMSELLKIKNRELKLKAAELEIRRMENHQIDEALYETTTDEALKERPRQMLFG
nr:hypothetical protein [Tanacetum cinerariifolium]